MKRRLLVCLLVALVAVMAAFAQGQKETSDNYKVFLISMDQMDQHWVKVDEGARAAAEELGNIDYTWSAPDVKDDAKQIECVNNAVAAGADCILVAPNGPDAITTGAQNDLEKVTQTARNMVTTYGMSFKMGNMAYGKSEEHVFMGRDFGHSRDYSEEIAADIDREVKRIVDERYTLAKELLLGNRDMLEVIAKELLERETLDEEEFVEIMNRVESARQPHDV